MSKKPLSLLFVLFILYSNAVKAGFPKIGEAAPVLKLTSLLQASNKLEQDLKSLQGKVVVLEFWATWCGPCIAAMPHLNDLSEKYKGKGVQFISITDESNKEVNQFLKKRKINGWIGLDADRTMFETYEVPHIPFTVVIGANGNVLGYPDSGSLSAEMLNLALEGKDLGESAQFPMLTDTEAKIAKPAAPIYELSIRPSSSEGTSSSISSKSYDTRGASALQLLKVAFDAELNFTEVIAKLPEGKFDVIATNVEDASPDWSWRGQLKGLLQDVWKLNVRKELQEKEVYELIATRAAEKRLIKAKPDELYSKQSAGDGTLVGRNTSVSMLAKILQDSMAVPVVDLTNLKGKYDYNLYYDQGKPGSLLQSLEKETGLKLRKVKRQVELLVITPRG